MIIRTDILILSVFHAEAFWDDSQLDKPQTFVKVPGMNIAFNHRIELQNAKADAFALHQRILYKQFPKYAVLGTWN